MRTKPSVLPEIDSLPESPALTSGPNDPWRSRTRPVDLPEQMDGPCSREELRACLEDLAWVNRVLFGYRPILAWLNELHLPNNGEAIRILDVGCGSGDTLREVERWAARRRIRVELTGLDQSADTIAIARQAQSSASGIQWVAGDVFAFNPKTPPNLVISSLMTHHLEDADVVRLLGWMDGHARWGWAINDLSRHPTPAKLFGLFARAFRLHPFVRHDGPVSFRRAFRAEDWESYCRAAGLPRETIEIRGYSPGRLRVSRKKVR